jgi:hypothetical protein
MRCYVYTYVRMRVCMYKCTHVYAVGGSLNQVSKLTSESRQLHAPNTPPLCRSDHLYVCLCLYVHVYLYPRFNLLRLKSLHLTSPHLTSIPFNPRRGKFPATTAIDDL